MTDFIRLLAIDPTMTNFGLAKMLVSLDGREVQVEDLRLLETKKGVTKVVRQNSDDLRRAGECYAAALEWARECDMIAAEVPSGAQSARAAISFGIVIGLLAALESGWPLIQVMPREVKKTVTGRTTASKDEMIAWAVKRFPDAPWLRHKRNGKMMLTDKNEHIADACAVGVTAAATADFRHAMVGFRMRGKGSPSQILCAN